MYQLVGRPEKLTQQVFNNIRGFSKHGLGPFGSLGLGEIYWEYSTLQDFIGAIVEKTPHETCRVVVIFDAST